MVSASASGQWTVHGPCYLGGPTGGAKKHPFGPLSFGFAEALFCSNVAPTVIGEGRRHRVPEVFEPGTVGF